MTERTHRRISRRTGTVLAGAALLAGGVAGPALADGPAGDQVSAAAPVAAPAPAAAPAAAPTASGAVGDVSAFFDSGYTYDDAVALAKQWNSPDVGAAKVAAAQKLAAGETLPVAPSNVEGAKLDAAMNAFYDAGYTYDDAVALAEQWSSTDSIAAKVTAGEKLAAGETLPIPPSGTPAS